MTSAYLVWAQRSMPGWDQSVPLVPSRWAQDLTGDTAAAPAARARKSRRLMLRSQPWKCIISARAGCSKGKKQTARHPRGRWRDRPGRETITRNQLDQVGLTSRAGLLKDMTKMVRVDGGLSLKTAEGLAESASGVNGHSMVTWLAAMQAMAAARSCRRTRLRRCAREHLSPRPVVRGRRPPDESCRRAVNRTRPPCRP